jgi:hypothetical protein
MYYIPTLAPSLPAGVLPVPTLSNPDPWSQFLSPALQNQEPLNTFDAAPFELTFAQWSTHAPHSALLLPPAPAPLLPPTQASSE